MKITKKRIFITLAIVAVLVGTYWWGGARALGMETIPPSRSASRLGSDTGDLPRTKSLKLCSLM